MHPRKVRLPRPGVFESREALLVELLGCAEPEARQRVDVIQEIFDAVRRHLLLRTLSVSDERGWLSRVVQPRSLQEEAGAAHAHARVRITRADDSTRNAACIKALLGSAQAGARMTNVSDSVEALADLNLIESIREHARWQTPAHLEETDGLLLFAGATETLISRHSRSQKVWHASPMGRACS